MDAISKLLKMIGGGAQAVGNFVAPATTKGLQNTANSIGTFGALMGSKNDDEKKKLQQQLLQQAAQAANSHQAARGELGSFGIPFGEGTNIASKFLLPGALTGAAQASANDQNPLTGALSGATGAGLIGGASGLLGKAIGGIGSKIADTGENLGLRRYGLTKMDVNKLGDKLGQPVQDFLKENNLIGKGVEDLGGVIKPLQEQFDTTANNANLKVNTNDLLEKFAQKIQALKGEAAPELQKKGADLEQYANNLFNKVGDNAAAPEITAERRTIDNLVKDFANSGDAVNASKNRVIRDLLQGSVQDAAQGAGVDLKGIGSKLNKLYSFEDVASKRAPQATGLPVGLIRTLAGGSGASLGGVLGGIPGALLGGAAGMAGESIMNNPNVIEKAATVLPQVGNAIKRVGSGNPILDQILGQVSSHIGGQLTPPSPSGNGENNNNNPNTSNNIQVNAATNNSQNIPQGNPMSSGIDPNMEVTLSDGSKATYGQLQQKGMFQAASEEPQQAQSPISDEQFKQLMIQDLIKNGGRNLDKLSKVQELLSGQGNLDTQLKQVELATKKKALAGGATKPLSAQAQKDVTKANAALNAVSRIQDKLQKDPSLLYKKMNPLDQSGRQLDADMKSAIDVIGYFRTGATLTPQQRADYISMFPSPLDDATTKKAKIDAINAELQGYIGASKAPSDTDQLMQMLGGGGQ